MHGGPHETDFVFSLVRIVADYFLRSRGLNFPRMMILFRLAHKGQCSVSDISHHMQISAPGASQLLDKLVEVGYVSRAENNDDRRMRNIEITSKGLALVQELKKEHQQKLITLMEAVPLQEREQLRKSLETLNRILRSMQ
ncbi:MarR family winged helix-turn-helix transcriptional regulator [Gracilinema caldarium]|uniref:MarR family winged helix-turn-helix transcriptional regulator n=1 Tax=Gracilinema caldarium TaxID=215591 RepID=UPI0003189AA4|nr:MarR family transcriptional regulator [Gracilinema caldarium]